MSAARSICLLFIPLRREFKTRLYGKVIGCQYDNLPAALPGWVECYGSNAGAATCIKIELDK